MHQIKLVWLPGNRYIAKSYAYVDVGMAKKKRQNMNPRLCVLWNTHTGGVLAPQAALNTNKIKPPFFFLLLNPTSRTHPRQILQHNCVHHENVRNRTTSLITSTSKWHFSKEPEMFSSSSPIYTHIRSRSQLHSTPKLLHSEPAAGSSWSPPETPV